jgi:hypothetical protein
MTWKFFGDGENLPLANKWIGYGAVALILISPVALWIDFVPSEGWLRWGTYLAATLAVAFCVYFVRGVRSGAVKLFWPQPRRKLLVVFAVIPFMLFGLIWLLVARVAPDAYSRIAGAEVRIVTQMHAEYRTRRRGCDYRLKGEILERAIVSRYLCVSPSFTSFPSEPWVVLTGRETRVGLHISNVELAPDSGWE